MPKVTHHGHTALAVAALLLCVAFLAGTVAPAQDAPTKTPTKTPTKPTALETLGAALQAHRGTAPKRRPTGLLFEGTVVVTSEKGDVNTFNLDQWYERVNGKDTIATRLNPTGTATTMSVSGFDGKRHYLLIDNKKTFIDFDSTYKQDLARIKDDLARTRFIIDTFFAGALLERPEELKYVKWSTDGKLECHIVDRIRNGKLEIRYYVNAKKGQKPYFMGIEFPKTKTAPKQNFCFSVTENKVKRFGGVAIPQEMRVFHNDGADEVAKIWITKVSIDPKSKANPALPARPTWLPKPKRRP